MILFSILRGESINNKNKNNKTFTDERDGKTYKLVKIGKQVWMAENLADKANKGCWAYNQDTSNVSKYGYLYNYETAKNVCPDGYHLPTKSEFETLLKNYGGSKDFAAWYAGLISKDEGFLAVLGGKNIVGNKNYPNEVFDEKDNFGYFWSASSYKQFWRFYTYTKDNAWILFVNGVGKGALMT